MVNLNKYMRHCYYSMPSATTIILLAAVGAGAYYVYAKPTTEIKPTWVEPQYENPATVHIAPPKQANIPRVTKIIKPDNTPAPILIKPLLPAPIAIKPIPAPNVIGQSDAALWGPKYTPRMLRLMEKNGGFAPGF
jgi:hypothetical protein